MIEPPVVDGGVPPARSVRRLLMDAQVGPFFAGALALATGIWAFNITVSVLAFSLTGSSAFVGAITAAQFAAPLLLSLAAGRRADTADRLNQVLTGQMIGFAALVSLVLWGLVQGFSAAGTPQALLLVAAVMGFGFSVSAPALQAVVPNLVHAAELQPAVTIHAATFNLGRALGPALAGAILVAGGPLWSFVVTLGCYAIFIAALLRVRAVRPQPAPVATARSRVSVRQVLRNPSLRVHLVGVAVTALVADPIITLAPAFAENLGVGSGWIGALGATFGLGSAAVLLVAGRAQRRLGLMGASRLGLGCLSLAVVGLGNWHHAGGAIALALVAGAGFLLCQSSLTAAIQENAVESQRGVTMALWTMAFIGSRPFSALLDGSAAELWSPGVATALVAAAGAAYAVRLRARHEPVRPSGEVATEDGPEDAGGGTGVKMSTELVTVEPQDDHVVIWLDRPEKRNALDRDMMRALDLAVSEVAQQELPVVFRSRSPGMFVAGADVAHLRERTLADSLGRTASRLFSRIAELAQPTIAAVDGPAFGGGCELALACDFRVTTTGALWGLPEVRLGLVPSAGGLTRLRALVGGAWATDLILTGRIIDGVEAHRIGLATRLVPDEELSNAVSDLVGTLERNGRLAVQLAKEALRSRDDDRLVDALAQAALISTQDTQSRIERFLHVGR